MTSTTGSLIDLTGSSLSISSDGSQYCYTIVANVNGKKFNQKKCRPLTKDTVMDRVLCLGAAVDAALEFYKQGVGASQLDDSAKQEIYNDIVKQLLPNIKAWEICDPALISSTYDKVTQMLHMSTTSQAVVDLQKHLKLLNNALSTNGCTSPSSSSGTTAIKWYVWLIIALAVVSVLALAVWKYMDRKKGTSKLSSASRRRA